jgi:hypothetical protein
LNGKYEERIELPLQGAGEPGYYGEFVYSLFQGYQTDFERRLADLRFFLASLILSFFLTEGFIKNRLRLSSLNRPSLMSWRFKTFNAFST